MDNAMWMPLPGSFAAFRKRLVSIMRQLADDPEAKMGRVSGFAAFADFLTGRALAPVPGAIEAAIKRASGRA